MLDEYNTLIINYTWLLVPCPANVNVVHSMWLFRHKFHVDGSLRRYKDRLIANGRSQQQGIDCDETFSPVVKPATIHTVLSLAISREWPTHQLDVKNAFLHGHLSKIVYMHHPPGFVNSTHPDYVCHLQHSLYGLKQAPRAWFCRFASFAIRIGFQHSKTDTSLFIFDRGSNIEYLLLYLDDIILTASSTLLLQRIIVMLHGEFAMTDLGSLNYFFVISAQRSASGMFFSQSKFAEEILERARMQNCNPCRTLVDSESKLGHDGDLVSDSNLYRSLASSIQYLTFTRPNLSYAVQQVTLSRSNAGSEYHSVANVVAETAWIRNLLRELHTPFFTTTLVYYDNVTAVYMSTNPVQHQRTKHIEIDIHFVRDFVVPGHVRVLHACPFAFSVCRYLY
ncbi:ribonuclease H-like domain-containing protein [Tanacetum coccineum]